MMLCCTLMGDEAIRLAPFGINDERFHEIYSY